MTEDQDSKKQEGYEVDAIGYPDKFSYSIEYMRGLSVLSRLHSECRSRDAIAYFNEHLVPVFRGLFDETFILNCAEIEMDSVDKKDAYMKERGELSRLMTRTGIAPKPDIRIRYVPDWEAPDGIKYLSFDGSNRSEDD